MQRAVGQRGWDRHAAHDHPLQRRWRRRVAHHVQQLREHAGHQRHVCDPELPDVPPGPVGVETFAQNGRGPRFHAAVEHRQRAHLVQREAEQPAVAGVQPQTRARSLHGRGDVARSEHRPLRLAPAAARADDEQDAVCTGAAFRQGHGVGVGRQPPNKSVPGSMARSTPAASHSATRQWSERRGSTRNDRATEARARMRQQRRLQRRQAVDTERLPGVGTGTEQAGGETARSVRRGTDSPGRRPTGRSARASLEHRTRSRPATGSASTGAQHRER